MNLFHVHDPETVKLRFKLRTGVNWFAAIVLFTIVAAFSDSPPVEIFAGIILYLIFILCLAKRTIGMVCRNKSCGKYIETNRPWVCGNKNAHHRNDNTEDFPFINKCEHCGNEPKVYQCHHCGEPIFLTNDRSTIGMVKCADIEEEKRPVPVKRDEVAEALAQQNVDIHMTELRLKKAKLDVDLKQTEEILNPKRQLTEQEILEKSAQEFMDRNLSGPVIVERLRAKYAEEFKNDPDGLKKANLAVEAWAKDHLELF